MVTFGVGGLTRPLVDPSSLTVVMNADFDLRKDATLDASCVKRSEAKCKSNTHLMRLIEMGLLRCKTSNNGGKR